MQLSLEHLLLQLIQTSILKGCDQSSHFLTVLCPHMIQESFMVRKLCFKRCDARTIWRAAIGVYENLVGTMSCTLRQTRAM